MLGLGVDRAIVAEGTGGDSICSQVYEVLVGVY